MGHTLVMGRKTYESIGRPLPGRQNIVITRQHDYSAPGCLVAKSLQEALAAAGNAEKIFIAGGGEIYEQALSITDEIYLTTIHRHVDGDRFFPEFSTEVFHQVFTETIKEPEPYTFTIYGRCIAKTAIPN